MSLCANRWFPLESADIPPQMRCVICRELEDAHYGAAVRVDLPARSDADTATTSVWVCRLCYEAVGKARDRSFEGN